MWNLTYKNKEKANKIFAFITTRMVRTNDKIHYDGASREKEIDMDDNSLAY